MAMLLFFICKLSFCLFYVVFKDRKVLSLLSPLVLQPQAALLSNNFNKCYFQMGGTIWGSAMWLCTGIDYLSLYLSHFTSVSCLIFFSEFWRTRWKLLPLICPRGYNLEKCLNMVLNCFAKEGLVRQGRSGAREVSSAAAEQLCTTQSHAGKGRSQWKPVSPYSISPMKMWCGKKQTPGPQICRHLRTL